MNVALNFSDISIDSFYSQWPDGILILANDGTIIDMNPRATEIIELTQAHRGQNAHDILCPNTRRHHHRLEDCPILGTQDRTTVYQQWFNQEGRAVDIKFREVHRQASYFAIEFKNAEETSIDVELAKMKYFAEVNPSAIADYSSLMEMGLCNPAMMSILVEHGFDETGLPNAIPEELKEYIKGHKKLEKNSVTMEFEVDNQFYSWSLFPFKCESEESILLTGHDITEKKFMEERFRRMETLIEKEKQKEMQKQLRKIAHDLRAPLNTVVGYSTILKRMLGKDASEKTIECISKINNAGHSVAESISEKLNLSTYTDFDEICQPEYFDYKILLGNIAQQVSESCALSVAIEDRDTSFKVYADQEKLKKLLFQSIQIIAKDPNIHSIQINRSHEDNYENNIISALEYQNDDIKPMNTKDETLERLQKLAAINKLKIFAKTNHHDTISQIMIMGLKSSD